ncbi:response regulator transcription factor [Pseudomonas sp. CFBP 13719]|uniref:response regulator transcription factor n=1 Tax=Pseudomonas sp. CFBP 13719 TaxID=2775303 RepID=UPI00177DE285|nr:response regulator transcription factor [Pseudomonas sp. CFBP 13719]MBD8683697.1 response regulator transcription factor [Pseudomonas sp. CFBP 13719]
MNLLYISDTPDTALQCALAEHATTLHTIDTATAAQALAQGRYGFIVLALERSGQGALEHCLAHRGNAAVMLLLTGDDRQARIAALRAGADACLAQPVAPAEVLARLQALARPRPRAATLPPSRLWLSPSRLMVGRGKRQQSLTVSEHRLLAMLASNPGAVSRQSIEQQLWGSGQASKTALIERHVCNLRRKLAQLDCPEALQTLRGFGYSLAEPLLLRAD